MRFVIALIAVALLGIGVGACGGEDSNGPSESSSPAEVEAKQAELDAEVAAHNAEVRDELRERRAVARPTETEQAARQSAERFYEILATDRGGANRTTIDSESFCDLMSEEARAQTVHYAEVSSGLGQQWDCESAVDLLVIRSKRAGGFEGTQRAEVIGVNAEGDRATATIRFGAGQVTSVPLVREDGEWKLGASAVGEGGG